MLHLVTDNCRSRTAPVCQARMRTYSPKQMECLGLPHFLSPATQASGSCCGVVLALKRHFSFLSYSGYTIFSNMSSLGSTCNISFRDLSCATVRLGVTLPRQSSRACGTAQHLRWLCPTIVLIFGFCRIHLKLNHLSHWRLKNQ